MISRRRFLASGAILFAVQPRAAVRLVLRGDLEKSPGALLALEEMDRTAALLGRRIDRSAHPEALVVDLAAWTVAEAGSVFHVRAAKEPRRAAMRAWQRENPGNRALPAVTEWHPALTRFGAEQLNQRFERRFAAPMQSSEWKQWMAVKIAVDAQLRSVPLSRGRFDGHKGTALYFGPDRHLVQPLCVVYPERTLYGMWP